MHAYSFVVGDAQDVNARANGIAKEGGGGQGAVARVPGMGVKIESVHHR